METPNIGLRKPTLNPVNPPLSLHSPTCKSCKSELPSSGKHGSGGHLEVAGSLEGYREGPRAWGLDSRSLRGWGHRGRVPAVSQEGPKEMQASESLVGCGWGRLRRKRVAPAKPTQASFTSAFQWAHRRGQGRGEKGEGGRGRAAE